MRELTGFFFNADNTLTIYEFRQFGKRYGYLLDVLGIDKFHVVGVPCVKAKTVGQVVMGRYFCSGMETVSLLECWYECVRQVGVVAPGLKKMLFYV